MGRLRALLDTLNSLTGISTRHHKALRDAKDWARTVQRFLTMHNLYGSSNFDSLFENIGEAKVDLTTITHRARPLIKTATNIKGKQVSPLIVEIADDIESLRRALINPSLHDATLSKVILRLRMSFERLQEALSEIENT